MSDAPDHARAAAEEIRQDSWRGYAISPLFVDEMEAIIRRHYQPLEAALRRVLEIHRTQPDGHCLFCGAVPCPTVQAVLEKLEGK